MSQNSAKKYLLGVIGGGVMARAIVCGAAKKGVFAPQEVCVCEPDNAKRAAFESEGYSTTENARFLADNCAYLLISVKPQAFCEVAEALRGARLPVLVSIMAGKTKRAVLSALGVEAKIARVMPNLPCSVGEGMAGVDACGLSQAEKAFVLGLFSAVGKAVEVPESLLDAVTGVSGSGPAYVYLFLQSLVKAGMEQGLDEEQAKTLALQTVKGGAAYAEESGKSYEELIAAVSSKGGTTLAALASFDRDDFAGAVSRAVDAAVKRAKELSE